MRWIDELDAFNGWNWIVELMILMRWIDEIDALN